MIVSSIWIILTVIAAVALYFLEGVTAGSLIIIVSFFVYAMWNIWVMYSTFRIVNTASKDENIAESIKTSRLLRILKIPVSA